jgi:uncharacterized protein
MKLIAAVLFAGSVAGISTVDAQAPNPMGVDVTQNPVRRARPQNDDRVAITRADVAASNEKASMAFAELTKMWQDEFRRRGARYMPPDLVRFREPIRTACGIMTPRNAMYCENDNTIYYDDVFVASLAKRAALQFQTDGDMAAVGVIAHEVGHAAAMQLGQVYRDSYGNEATADCLAGAFALHAQKNNQLEKGDLDEAFLGVSLGGDPDVESLLTGDARTDRRIIRQVARGRHGTRDQRLANFRIGLDRGAAACLDSFKPAA